MYIIGDIVYAGEPKPLLKVYGVPVWNDGDIDIAPETLYEQGELIVEAV